MSNYEFTNGADAITIEASNYQEALDGLIFKSGSEQDAACFVFQGCEPDLTPETADWIIC